MHVFNGRLFIEHNCVKFYNFKGNTRFKCTQITSWGKIEIHELDMTLLFFIPALTPSLLVLLVCYQ